MFHTIGMIAIGFAACIAIQATLSVGRKILGLASAHERAEAEAASYAKRARDAEDKLRILECGIAASGNPVPEPAKRVTARPVQ